MKVLVINYMALPLPPVKDGAVEHLIDMYLKHNEINKEHDITVYSIHDDLALDESNKYNFTEFKYIKLDNFFDKLLRVMRYSINKLPKIRIGNQYIRKIKKELKTANSINQYDVVIIENAPEFGLEIRKIYKGRMILHLHNDYLNRNTKLAHKILNSFDEVFVLSNYIGNQVKTIQNSDVIIKTLYNGIDLNKFSTQDSSKEDVKSELGIKENEIVILYSGRLVPEKGVKEFLEAISLLSSKERIKVIIMGGAIYGKNIKDSYYNQLQEIVTPFQDKVIFLGHIKYSNVNKIYSIADIGVVPSLCNDGFNLTLVEYMANSTPLIVSNRGALPEIVNSNCATIINDDTYFINNLSVAIKNLIENPYMRKVMGEQSLIASKKFSSENYCENFYYYLNEELGECK